MLDLQSTSTSQLLHLSILQQVAGTIANADLMGLHMSFINSRLHVRSRMLCAGMSLVLCLPVPHSKACFGNESSVSCPSLGVWWCCVYGLLQGPDVQSGSWGLYPAEPWPAASAVVDILPQP
jgi:hypothetical protein